MPELWIGVAVRDISTSGDVEIVNCDAADFRRQVPTIAHAAKVVMRDVVEGMLRQDCKTVVAFFTPDRAMLISQLVKAIMGKLVIRAFGLLQTKHVRFLFLQKLEHDRFAQADRVDVPSGDKLA